ncbi:MAG: SDR family NAD(P)-dependent oxidoreductase [Acidimicrobiales bacterium]
MTRLTKLSRSLEGARVVVTGAASGMGRATAMLFADEGARVAAADRDGEALAGVVEEIRRAHGAEQVVGVPTDVAVDEDRRRLVTACVDAFGGLDVLVNNAGISGVSSVFSDDEDFGRAWDRIIAVNLTAHAHLVRAALPHLLAAPNGGRVINIASTEAFVATGGLAAYTASKHGVVGLTKSLAVELGPRGVTVNAVCPGPIDTGMTSSIPQERRDRYTRLKVPLRRYGEPEEVAHMTVSIALPAMRYMTGSVVRVDGGLVANH